MLSALFRIGIRFFLGRARIANVNLKPHTLLGGKKDRKSDFLHFVEWRKIVFMLEFSGHRYAVAVLDSIVKIGCILQSVAKHQRVLLSFRINLIVLSFNCGGVPRLRRFSRFRPALIPKESTNEKD